MPASIYSGLDFLQGRRWHEFDIHLFLLLLLLLLLQVVHGYEMQQLCPVALGGGPLLVETETSSEHCVILLQQ